MEEWVFVAGYERGRFLERGSTRKLNRPRLYGGTITPLFVIYISGKALVNRVLYNNTLRDSFKFFQSQKMRCVK